MTKQANQPAFPVDGEHHDLSESEAAGLTKREYIAALALQGWLASAGESIPSQKYIEMAAEYSVKHADALLKALEDVNDDG